MDKATIVVLVSWVVGLLVSLGITAFIIYAAIHFIFRYW